MTTAAYTHHQFRPGLKDPARCDGNYPLDCDVPEREHDLRMMQDPDAWPRWPVLPLKRSTPDDPLDCAFLMCRFVDSGPDPEVWLGTIYEASDLVGDESKHVVYESWDALLADGWRVD